MPNLITESANTILERAIRQLSEGSQITKVTPGSKARTVLGIVSSEIERLENILNANIVLSLVNGAQGIYLDFIGELVGVERTRPTIATSSASSSIVQIYVDDGLTFGDLNSGAPIIIPVGTRVTSQDGTIVFALTNEVTLSSGSSEQSVSVRSLVSGNRANIPQGTLAKISFEGYSAFPDPMLKVRNLAAIDNGTDTESDSVFRTQITSAFLAAEAGNYNAIRAGLLGIGPVADVHVAALARGVGTADIILETQSGEVTDVTLEQARRVVNIVSSVGTDIKIRRPELIGLEMAVDIKYKRGTPQSTKDAAERNIRSSIRSVVEDVRMGSSLDLTALPSVIYRSSPEIISVGTVSNPISETIIWRDSVLSSTRTPILQQTQGTIELAFDERLVLEGTLKQAIRITEQL